MRFALKRLVTSFRHDHSGVAATEYAVMLAYIALTAIVSFAVFGDLVLGIWTIIAEAAGTI